MTLHVFHLNPGSVMFGVCSCGTWDGHFENHHLHTRTRNGHNMKREIDYLEDAKEMIRSGRPDLATPYALTSIAESLRAITGQQLAAATLAGAQAGATAAAEAITTVLGIVTTGNVDPQQAG